MYCGQCGKQLKDNMLFCPYCGTPASLPEQDEAAAVAVSDFAGAEAATDEFIGLLDMPEMEMPAAADANPRKEGKRGGEERVVSLFEEYDRALASGALPEDEEFEPLNFDFGSEDTAAEQAEEIVVPVAAAAVNIPEEQRPIRPQKRRENTVIQPADGAKGRAKKTYIPVQDIDPDNIFMDKAEEVDEYDAGEGEDYFSGFEEDYEYEDREEGSFFRRHIRGIVGLLLMLLLAAICLIWASTPKGQIVLAKMNIARNAEVYAKLGYEAYEQNNDLQAAGYYEKAYSRDNKNYTYAHGAMVAYYEAGKLDSATSMLKICVALQPNNPEPYAEFLILYPDAATRPWEITALIRDGYQRTGDQRLNIN